MLHEVELSHNEAKDKFVPKQLKITASTNIYNAH